MAPSSQRRKLGEPTEYRMIIDCLLNLPLLFWASETTGNPAYKQKATAHIQTAVSCLLREDGSTYHTFYFDPETGKPLHGATAQGSNELATNYAVTGSDEPNGLLLHGVYAKSSPHNTVKDSGVDECTWSCCKAIWRNTKPVVAGRAGL